mmetsp:Transcript_20713/g.57508  ORF Transcript_20713/g.57508 Transcript_20713/m.57508 type:complete len:169 (+) Transcript_20713:206-712(+)
MATLRGACAGVGAAVARARSASATPARVQALRGPVQALRRSTCNGSRMFLTQRVAAAGGSRRSMVCMASSMVDLVKAKNSENPIIVYSKTTCPFCMEVKNLFKNIGVEPTVVEIDQLEDGPDVQAALMDVSGSRTVPQIFIGGNFVGGCDGMCAWLHRSYGPLFLFLS